MKKINFSEKFGVTAENLQKLMECRGGEEALERLEEDFGGLDGLIAALRVKTNKGIESEGDIKIRTEVFGCNEIPAKASKSIFILMWEALQDVTLIILIIAALISLGLSLYVMYMDEDSSEDSGWIESVAIMVAVAVVVLVVSFNDWQKERQFRGLQMKVESESRVQLLRYGEVISIHQNRIVVGDICLIKYGDVLPADGIVIKSNGLRIDESSLTGESDHVKKGVTYDPILLSGSRVMEGSGRMIVTAVGQFSQAGIIFGLLQNSVEEDIDDVDVETASKQSTSSKRTVGGSKEKSILQRKLTILAIQIGYAGTFVALITVMVLTLSYISSNFIQQGKYWNTARDIEIFVNFFIIGVTVLVVAVPEGLPLAVTIALAYSVKKMMADNNLVRHLDACETMGNATSICSDKTGTLTTNKMTAVKFYILGNVCANIEEIGNITEDILFKLTVGIVINCSYTSKIIPSKIPGGLHDQIGNKTECALLGFVCNLSQNVEHIRKLYPEENLFKIYTFNSERKSMSVILETEESYNLYSKGASEILLNKCKWIIGKNSTVEVLTPEIKNFIIKNVIEAMADESLRTICLAYRTIIKGKRTLDSEAEARFIDFDNDNDVHDNMVCYAIIGIEDPVRPEVPNAILMCQQAGIIVRMVTGDNISTARSVAYKCGIIKPGDGYEVLDSAEFNKRIRDPITNLIRQDKLDMVFPKLRVLARSSPQDKYNLVNGIINSFQFNNREIVAVTGDGTNDGPALKKADVGFAMGIAGTDVAKEASDIILTDDNFNSIVKAVMWGRNVYDSITKFLQFQLTVNVVAIIIAFIGTCFVSDSPLRAIQMLWVNLIMDTLASLALATEKPTEELLKRSPYGRTASLINKTMIKNIIGHAFYQLIIIIALLFYGDQLLMIENGQILLLKHNKSPNKHFTVIFNTFVLMTLFNEFNARKIHGQRNVFSGLTNNPLFSLIWVTTMIGQVLIIEFGNKALSTTSLDLNEWLWCLCFGVGELLWGQIIISIPDSILPNISLSKNVQNDMISEGHFSSEKNDLPILSGEILWLKGLTRLHSQLQVIEAFRFGLEEKYESLNHNLNNLRLRRKITKVGTKEKDDFDSGDNFKVSITM